MSKKGLQKELSQMMTSRNVQKKRRRRVRVCSVLLLLLALVVGFVTWVNLFLVRSAEPRILKQETVLSSQGVDCILVLGVRVLPDGTPSRQLEDRCRRAVSLWKAGVAPVLLMSGDKSQTTGYDEPAAMKRYAVEHGVPPSAIVMDPHGYETYDSLYRAHKIYQAKRVIVVTQRYHMFRALYIAEQLGLEAVGVTSNERPYATQIKNSIREMLARVKAYVKCKGQALPRVLGDPVELPKES